MSQVAITVRDFITENRDIIGSGPDDKCSLVLINKARVIAYTVEDCVGTIGYLYAPMAYVGTFLLDSRFEAIREVLSCNTSNKYGNMSGVGTLSDISAGEYTSCGGSPLVARVHGRAYCPIQLTESNANTCDLCFAWMNVQDRDNKVSLTIHYIDTKGAIRKDIITPSHFTDGMTALTYTPAQITKIYKPVTRGRLIVHTNTQEAFIEPWETTPSYSIYSVSGYGCQYGVSSYYTGPVLVKAKKRCLPYVDDSLDDILDINPEALSSLVIAVKARSERGPNWVQDYSSAVQLGINFLKAEATNEESTSHGMTPVNMHNAFFDDVVASADMISGDSWGY